MINRLLKLYIYISKIIRTSMKTKYFDQKWYFERTT